MQKQLLHRLHKRKENGNWMKVGVMAAIVALDGMIKKKIEKQNRSIFFQKGRLTIRKCHNKGAVYSIGSQKPELVTAISTTLLLLLGVRWIKDCRNGKNGGKNLGYAWLLGGGISNTLDRFRRKYVVDYIHVEVPILKKIIFNLSDVCIWMGGIWIMLGELVQEKKKTK